MSKANERQVGGQHYSSGREGQLQHWDIVRLMKWDYMQGQITKYLDRHRKKNGREDLEKAAHYLEKYIEQEYGDKRPRPAHEITEKQIASIQRKVRSLRGKSTPEQRAKWRKAKRAQKNKKLKK